MRHAKVQIENRSIYANEFNEMIEEYDHAPIEEQMDNEDELKKVADEANYFLSSGLRRSLDSLALLGKKADDIDEIFAEAELPSGRRKWIKLPLLSGCLSLDSFGFWGTQERGVPTVRVKKMP